MTNKKILNLDMDGVVADWIGGVEQIIGYRMQDPKQHYPDQDWQKIIQSDRLFRNLPKMPLADQFVNLARQFRDELDYNLVFLTAVPNYNDVPWAFWDKVLWVQERYPDIPVHFGPYSNDKQKQSKPGNILVDDRPDNCTQWETKGGTAVNVPVGNEIQGLQELQQLFDRKRSLRNLSQM
jgi:5'(3')-deoxyribonucleotidase